MIAIQSQQCVCIYNVPFSQETSGYDRNKKEQENTIQEDIAYKLLPCFVLLKLNDKRDVVRFTEADALPGELLCRGMGVTAGRNSCCVIYCPHIIKKNG